MALKSVSGVDAVEVNLEKGLANVKMKPGNTATFKQLQEAITKNGFTMKASNVSVIGQVIVRNGQPQLRVSGSNDLVNLVPESNKSTNVNSVADKVVLVEGILNEAPKGKLPDTVRYRTISEEK